MPQELTERSGTDDDLAAYRDVLLPTTRDDVVVQAAKGDEIKLDTGDTEKWVIDATSQVGTNPLGHRNPALMQALEAYRESDAPMMIAGNDAYHPYQRMLAEEFTDIFPGDHSTGDIKAYFCTSGSEAVERGCLKAAQLYQGGNTYMAFHNAFHGRTALALSCNFSKAAHTERYNSLFRTLPAPFPDPRRDADECLAQLEENIHREGPANVNAVIVEPIQGEGGYVVPDDAFLPGLRKITREYDIPLVLDEVQASLRTGHWFACEHWDIEPDMIAVAKAFSGGITPFGAALIRDEYATEESGKHSGTFGGNPKECFIALKTIEIIQENDYLDHAREQGQRLADAWQGLEQYDCVTEERGVGLMRGIEFTDAEARDAVLDRLLDEHDIYALGCGNDQINPTLRFLLPVNVDAETVNRIADAVNESVDTVAAS